MILNIVRYLGLDTIGVFIAVLIGKAENQNKFDIYMATNMITTMTLCFIYFHYIYIVYFIALCAWYTFIFAIVVAVIFSALLKEDISTMTYILEYHW